MSFIKLIFLIFALYLFFRLFTGFILPWIVKLIIKRFQKRFYEQNPGTGPLPNNHKGKVTIHRMSDKKENEIPPDLGEYIDFEEINNNQTPPNE